MSSHLRSLQTSVGYFVMSGDTIPDGSDHGLYDLSADTVFANNGLVDTNAKFQFNSLLKDDLFVGNDTSMGTVTFQDLGKTIYGGHIYSGDGGALQGVSDMRKVRLVTSGTYNASQVYYVPLGTNLRNSTGENLISTNINPSVALVGKLL